MSEDVEQQDRMVTDSVWRALPVGDSIEVAVEVRFDHEGQDYRLLRSATLRKESDDQGPLSARASALDDQSRRFFRGQPTRLRRPS